MLTTALSYKQMPQFDVGSLSTDLALSTINGIPSAAIRLALERILRSRVFVHSHRIRRFLQFIVEESLAGQHHRLKEYLIGLEVFNRMDAFDPRVDSIVRVEARRLRAKLDEYYSVEGRDDEVRIELRKGSYVPVFDFRSSGQGEEGKRPREKRKAVSFEPTACNGDGQGMKEFAEEIKRRLAHSLIKHGHFEVMLQSTGAGRQDGDGASRPEPLVKPDFLVQTSLESSEDHLRLTLQASNAAEAFVFSELATFTVRNVDGVDDLARSLTRALVTCYPRVERGRAKRDGEQREPFALYLRGRYHWKLGSAESVRSSIALFEKAVEQDPAYGAAWAALAQALIWSCIFGDLDAAGTAPRMREAVNQAMVNGDHLPETYLASGAVKSLLDRDWAGGEADLQKAVQLNAHDSTAHVVYGLQLACRGLRREAVTELECALDLDPASLSTNFALAWLRGAYGQHEVALAHHRMVAQLAPDFPLAYAGIGWAHAAKGEYGEALAAFSDADRLWQRPFFLAPSKGYCHAKSGQRDQALKLMESAGGEAAAPATAAAVHAGLGDLNAAFEHLGQALASPSAGLPLQFLNPEFAELREHPRFVSILAFLGLAPEEKAEAPAA